MEMSGQALLQIAAQREVHKVHYPATHVLSCSCLFTLCLAGRNQGIIPDPPPSAPCREGEAGNIPVKCQMFGRGLRAADGFGGKTGNSSGAGSTEVCQMKDKWFQKSREG